MGNCANVQPKILDKNVISMNEIKALNEWKDIPCS